MNIGAAVAAYQVHSNWPVCVCVSARSSFVFSICREIATLKLCANKMADDGLRFIVRCQKKKGGSVEV